jgi:glyoxylase-like metal-dependent hydrolase (beta-lactamase superfamily II)
VNIVTRDRQKKNRNEVEDTAIEIGPIQLIKGGNRGRYPYCHSLYIPEAGLLIDPGSDRESLARLAETGAVREIWLSHWHEDHWGHLDLFDNLPLAMNRFDAPPVADLNTFFRWYGVGEELFEVWRSMVENQFHFHPREPDRFLEDGEIIDLAPGLTVEVIHSPGHTPGHLSFYFREVETLFLGDVDLTRFGPWYGDRDSDIEGICQSVARLREIPARQWIWSHETGFYHSETAKLWDDYLAVIDWRENALCRYLESGPRSLDEIAAQWIAYGKSLEPVEFYAYSERNHMAKHLERLMAANTVALENGRYHLR